MRTPAILLAALLGASLSGDDARLSPRFRTVYILEMSNALDQHLASRLTNARVLWVVLEPTSADAVLTDTIDEAFWNWLLRTYPGSGGPSGSGRNRDATFGRDVGSSSRHRGTIFLVDPRSRLVLWSTYELSRYGSPAELDRSAARIANQLKAAFGQK
jgi:hypothetical protein